MPKTDEHGSNRQEDRCVGTTPLTIAQAIEACNNYNLRKDSNRDYSNFDKHAASIAAATPPIVDLLAIITHVETNQRSNQQRSSLYVRIWINDTSSTVDVNSKTSHVQILCFGRRRYTELIDQLQIRSGDIMRFNRIVTMPSKVSTGNLNTCTFTYDVQNPENGPEYYRFGNTTDDNFADIERNKLQNGEEIPISMQTNPRCIRRLIEWYRRHHSPAIDTMVCYNKNDSRYIDSSNSVLNSLPCQYHSLGEFQSCIGLIGHVTVCVIQIEKFTSAPYRTKKRQLNNIAAANQLFVTLTDYTDVSSTTGMTQPMALVIDSTCDTNHLYSYFHSILSQAYSSNRPVVLTNMTSIRNRPHHPYPRYASHSLSSESTDGILIPTSKSDVKLIESPLSVYKKDWDLSPPQAPVIPLVPTINENINHTLEIIRVHSSISDISMFTPTGRKVCLSDSDKLDNDSFIDSLLSLISSYPTNIDGKHERFLQQCYSPSRQC
jgi:hypothetical protein